MDMKGKERGIGSREAVVKEKNGNRKLGNGSEGRRENRSEGNVKLR